MIFCFTAYTATDAKAPWVKALYWSFTATFEVKEGCLWKNYSFDDCAHQFRSVR
jgi:hypothetical protein